MNTTTNNTATTAAKKPASKKVGAKKAASKKATPKKAPAKTKKTAKKPTPAAKKDKVKKSPAPATVTTIPTPVAVEAPVEATAVAEKPNTAEKVETATAPWMDYYEMSTTDYAELEKSVRDMDEHSRWHPGIMSKCVRVNPIEAPMFAADIAPKKGFDPEMAEYTSKFGSQLYLDMPDGTSRLLDACGYKSLLGRACIEGSALGRMNPSNLSSVLNMALEVAMGDALVLERYGKVAALHSDANGGYCVMPISSLLSITQREVSRRCGKLNFLMGSNSHSYTTATWELPEVRDKLTEAYEMALLKAGHKSFYPISEMSPCVRLSTSDTANSAATLRPLFLVKRGGAKFFVQFTGDISVKHARKVSDGKDGLALFEEKASNELYSLLFNAAENAGRMAEIEVYNPVNTIVGICNKLRLPKKYGNAACEQAEIFMVNATCITAHDIYLMLNEAISEAGSPTSVMNLGETLAVLMNPDFDWSAYDVGGEVAWSN